MVMPCEGDKFTKIEGIRSEAIEKDHKNENFTLRSFEVSLQYQLSIIDIK